MRLKRNFSLVRLEYEENLNLDCEYIDLEDVGCRYLAHPGNVPKMTGDCKCCRCIIALSRLPKKRNLYY